MNKSKQEHINSTDNSRKSILARGCDPFASLEASKAIPPLIGNPEYVPTTNDADFIEELKSRNWSVIFFAPELADSVRQSKPYRVAIPKPRVGL